MKRISRRSAKRWAQEIVLLSAVVSVLSMIGCSRRYVMVDASKPANITQGEADRLYQDNEMCLKELEELRGR